MDMNPEDRTELSKWPFFLGYLSLLAVAIAIILAAPKPYSVAAMSGVILSGLIGPIFLLLPFLIEYFSRLKEERNQLRLASDEQFANSLRIFGELTELQQVFSRQAKQGATNFSSLEGLLPQLEKHSDHLNRLAEEFLQAAKSEKKAQSQTRLDSVAKEMASLLDQLKEIPGLLEKRISEMENSGPKGEAELERLSKKIEDLAASLQFQKDLPEAAPAPTLTETPKPEKRSKKSPLKKSSETQQELPVLEFDEDIGPEKQELVKTPLLDSEEVSLVANLHIGIGNVPYVRGEGAGLSWEKGTEMQFLEIGKWEWRASEAHETVRARIFLNDKISAFGEDIEINAGEQVEVFPEFPQP